MDHAPSLRHHRNQLPNLRSQQQVVSHPRFLVKCWTSRSFRTLFTLTFRRSLRAKSSACRLTLVSRNIWTTWRTPYNSMTWELWRKTNIPTSENFSLTSLEVPYCASSRITKKHLNWIPRSSILSMKVSGICIRSTLSLTMWVLVNCTLGSRKLNLQVVQIAHLLKMKNKRRLPMLAKTEKKLRPMHLRKCKSISMLKTWLILSQPSYA